MEKQSDKALQLEDSAEKHVTPWQCSFSELLIFIRILLLVVV
jgi:hypothetical protein